MQTFGGDLVVDGSSQDYSRLAFCHMKCVGMASWTSPAALSSQARGDARSVESEDLKQHRLLMQVCIAASLLIKTQLD